MWVEVSIREWTRFLIASNCETHCETIGEKEEIEDGDRGEKGESLLASFLRDLPRETRERIKGPRLEGVERRGSRSRSGSEIRDETVEPKTKKPGARAS